MNRGLWVPFAGTVVLLSATLLASSLAERRVPQQLALPLQDISRRISAWNASSEETLPPYTLRALKPTSYLARKYEKGPDWLDVFVAFYAQQRAGESMHSPKHCLPGAGWEIWRQRSTTVPVNGNPVEINEYSIENAGKRMLMLYWYQSKERIVASEYRAKVLLARDTVWSGQTAGSIVRIALPDTPTAHEQGIAFATELIGEVQRCLGK